MNSTRARDGESPQAYVERMLAEQIAGFDSSRQFYRKGFFYTTVATAALSALTTVLIAVSKIFDYHSALSVTALVTSSAITVVAAWDGFLRNRELWIQKTDAWMALQRLDAAMQYAKTKTSGALAADEIDRFHKDFDRILANEHDSWKRVRSTQSSSPRK